MANPEQDDDLSKDSERNRWSQRENRVFVAEAKVGESFKPNIKTSHEINPKFLTWQRCADQSKHRRTLGNQKSQCLQVPRLPRKLRRESQSELERSCWCRIRIIKSIRAYQETCHNTFQGIATTNSGWRDNLISRVAFYIIK